MRLKDKVAIITGAASGMGAADARLFAAEGATVLVTDILEEEGKAVAAQCVAAGGKAAFERLDVREPGDWKRVADLTIARYGKWDVLVNNAGMSGAGFPDVTDLDVYYQLMDTNLKGVFLGIRAAVPHMKDRGGSIINLSSISANTGTFGLHIAYGASKGGVRALTKSAAVQFGPHNIRVNSIHPGVMPPMRSNRNPTGPNASSNRLMPRIPLGRAGRAEEVANAALFLASDESSYITGLEVHVDGGFLAT